MRPLHELAEQTAHWNGGLGWKRNFRLTLGRSTFASLQWVTASGSVALARSAHAMATLERGAFSSTRIVAREVAGGRELGAFVADWRDGGRLTLCSGRCWTWRPETTSLSRWSFRGSDGKAALQLFVGSMGLSPSGTLAIEPDAAALPELALLVAFSWYLVVQTIDDSALLARVATSA